VSLVGKYATTIVVAHLLVNIAHGLAHRELRVGLPPSGSVFVLVVVLILPLVAMVLVWTAKRRPGLILLSLSMLGSCYSAFIIIFWSPATITCVCSPRVHGEPPLSSRRTDCSSLKRLELT